MNSFRFLLAIFLIIISWYTLNVGINQGWDLFSVFFRDLRSMNWSGQFNLDFTSFLVLSGLWVAWRNNYTPSGIILGLIASVGGMLFLAPYLLILSFQTKGDMKKILLG